MSLCEFLVLMFTITWAEIGFVLLVEHAIARELSEARAARLLNFYDAAIGVVPNRTDEVEHESAEKTR